MTPLSRRLAAAVFACWFVPTTAGANPHVADTPHLSPEQQKAKFRLPPGFEAQLVASEPEIQKPMNMAFDARGRLWLTDSVEYPYAVGPGEQGRDRVVILSDFGPDGRARSVEVFADGLNIPIGVLPLPSCDGCLVFSIPNLWLLRDTTGDGKADSREILLSGFGRDDTHGLVNGLRLGFDGRVHVNHGFRNSSHVRARDGSEIRMQSGNTFRVGLDGSFLEHFTHGQVNPFGSCFDERGNLYNADCHSKPMTQLLRGAYYDSFGKPHDGLGFGPEMIAHTHHSTALCGLVYYAADHFPPEFRGTMFLGDVTGNRIHHDRLQWRGSSPSAVERPAFLVSDDPWFRPADLQLGPDGALYVSDFYNRIIGHYEVPLDHPGRDRTSGRIWRIVWKGLGGDVPTPAMPRPDWTAATAAELTEDLGHANLTVRLIATHELARRGSAVERDVRRALERDPSQESKAHAVWVLERTRTLTDADLRRAASDPSALVRTHAQRLLAERPTLTAGERTLARAALDDEDALVRRCAAEVLGRHPDPDDLDALLRHALGCPSEDTHSTHVARMAIRDLLAASPDLLAGDLPSDGPEARRLVAGVALALPIPEATGYLLDNVGQWRADQIGDAARHVGRHGDAGHLGRLLDWLDGQGPGTQLTGYRSLKQGTEQRGGTLSEEALDRATRTAGEAMSDGGPGRLRALELTRELRLTGLREPVTRIARSSDEPAENRAAAFAALAATDADSAIRTVAAIFADAAEPVEVRESAALTLTGLNRADATAAALGTLTEAPARLARTIAAGMSDSRAGGEALLAAVAEGKVSARLLQEREIVARLRQRGIPDLDAKVGRLTAGLPSADARVLELLQRRAAEFSPAKASQELGAAVFKKHCAACHRIGTEGPVIGPQLDGIGNRGLARIMEDVLDPSRNIDRAMRTTRLDLLDGRVVSGLVLREPGEVVILANPEGKEIPVPKAEILERIELPISPMPANFDEVIGEKDFHDLMAFLLAQRQRTE